MALNLVNRYYQGSPTPTLVKRASVDDVATVGYATLNGG